MPKQTLTKKTWTVKTALQDLYTKSLASDFTRPVFGIASISGILFTTYNVRIGTLVLSQKYSAICTDIIELFDDFLQNCMNTEYMFKMWDIRYKTRNNIKVLQLQQQVEQLSNISVEQKELKITFENTPMERVKK